MILPTTTTICLAKAATELQTGTGHGIYHPADTTFAQCSRHHLRLTASQQREGVVLLARNGKAHSGRLGRSFRPVEGKGDGCTQ